MLGVSPEPPRLHQHSAMTLLCCNLFHSAAKEHKSRSMHADCFLSHTQKPCASSEVAAEGVGCPPGAEDRAVPGAPQM